MKSSKFHNRTHKFFFHLLWVFLLPTFLFTGCSPRPSIETSAPAPSMTLSPSRTSTLLPTFTNTPTTTVTPFPTSTPRAPEEIAYYRIRIEYSTNSPHSLLVIKGSQVLSGRVIKTAGEISESALYGDTPDEMGFFLVKPSEPNLDEMISATLDFAISADAIDNPFNFIVVTKVPYFASMRVSVFDGTGYVLLKELAHYSEYDNFFVSLQPLSSIAPLSLSILQPEKMVWAFYYPWFPDFGWSPNLADRSLNPVDSLNSEYVGRQIEEAQSAGIDGFLVSYNSDWADKRVELLMREADKRNFKIGFLIESADNPNNRMWPVKTIGSWIRHAIQKFSIHPSFARLEGKYLFVMYMSRDIPLADWAATFDNLAAAGYNAAYLSMSWDLSAQEVFGGYFEYFVNNADFPPGIHYAPLQKAAHYYALLADDGQPRIFAATVSPGFDAGPYDINNASPFIIEREDGATYRDYWQAAVEADADWVFITTWNEYGETTHIEPSLRYGDEYLQITGEYINLWKAK